MFVSIRRVLFAVGLSLTLVSIARSEPPAEKMELVEKKPVSYAGLDLEKEADARVLLGRLQQAAYHACGGNPRFHPSYTLMPKKTTQVFESCRTNAIDRAVKSIQSATLSRLFAEVREK
jgi:UrcA family protein